MKKRMPVIVCQVGSGLASLVTMAGCAGLFVGLIALSDWLNGPPGGRPHEPSMLGNVLVGLVLLAMLGLWWWVMRQGFYAHCLRFWHPEIAPPRKVACPECADCELCGGTRQVDEGTTTSDGAELWVAADGSLWCGPVTRDGSNFHYAKLSGHEGADAGGVKPSWILARSDADPTWIAFDYGIDEHGSAA